MSDIDLTDTVEITPDPSELRDTATELLAAADQLGAPVQCVESFGPGSFRVPRAVAEKAGIKVDDQDHEQPAEDTPKTTPRRGRASAAAATDGDAAN